MKLIIAGGRNLHFGTHQFNQLDQLHAHGLNGAISEVVSGGASGADEGGEIWARRNCIPVKQFLSDWNAHGKAAGPIRNRQMAEYADAVALFTGGAGTASMRREAKRAGITIYDFTNS